jgi:RNA polymerase sigma-70 factor (ECF subfamily)
MLMSSDRPAPGPAQGAPPQSPQPSTSAEPCPGAACSAPLPTARRASGVDPLLAGWFREHVERVWRIVARLGVPAHSVEDIVQETFITASRRRSDIQAGHEGSFLVGAAIRLSANYRRKAHVRLELGETPAFERETSPLPDAEQLLIAKRSRELLDRLLSELPEPQRAVFVLYELEGLSVPEIASALALPLGTVSSRVWRARARFSELARDVRGQSETSGES